MTSREVWTSLPTGRYVVGRLDSRLPITLSPLYTTGSATSRRNGDQGNATVLVVCGFHIGDVRSFF